jgi:photosystem II protein
LRLLCPTEILTGKGALAQFGYEVGLNTSQVDVFIVGLIAFNAIAALLPTSGTFVPDEEVESRPAGPLQDPTISLLNPKKFFSFKSFGFTKENELLVGRTAQLGFAASILGEYLTGKGPLAQFDFGECPAPAGCC